MWQALPNLIQNDPYLKGWNDTIFGNATAYFSLDPVVYHMDGDSGILDNAREIKMRIKAFAYVYRMTNDTKWVDRCWAEVQVSFVNLAIGCPLIKFLCRMLLHLALRQINGITYTSSTLQNFLPRWALRMTGYTTCGPLTKKLKFAVPLSNGGSNQAFLYSPQVPLSAGGKLMLPAIGIASVTED